MYIFFIFLLGLIIGSFLNAVIWRIHEKKSFLKGSSMCPKCKHKLSAKDLFPILSFLFLKGKCRYCKKKISWQYPLIELTTGIIFVLFYFQYVTSLDLAIFIRNLIFASILIIVFVYDLKWYLILDKVSIPAFVIALLFNLILGFSFLNLLVGILIGGGFFLLQFYISKGKWIGGGDIRLGAVMGAMLGWQYTLLALFLSYVSGAIFGSFLIILKKKDWSSTIPFGTFLATGTIITLLYGEIILNWYLGK